MDLDLQPQLEESVEAQNETPVTKQLVPVEQGLQPHSEFMPAMSVEQAIERKQQIVEFVKKVLIPGHDYGVTPGTDKPALYKPGAERFCSYFSLSADPVLLESIYDWTGKDHGGEPLFSFSVRTTISHRGEFICAVDSNCNSWEAKYRWRTSERTCPNCGAEAIKKSKYEGKEFYCWNKKGGCGAKFPPGSQEFLALETYKVEKVPNPNIFDQVNTVLRMAEKRGLVAGVIIAVNASEFFTVGDHTDREPLDDEGPPQTREEIVDRLKKGGPAASRASEPPPTALEEFDYDQMMRSFKEVKVNLEARRGEQGTAFYRSVFQSAGLRDEAQIRTKKQGTELWKKLFAQAEDWRAEDAKSAAPEEPPTPIDSQHGRIPEIGRFRILLRKAQPQRKMGEAEYERVIRECGGASGKSSDPYFHEHPEAIPQCISKMEELLDLWTNPPPKDDAPKDDEKQEDLGF